MDSKELMRKARIILEDSKTAVFATSDKSGVPHMRWMTPAILKDSPETIYAVTSPRFGKIIQLESQPEAEWMIQAKDLREIINLKCKTNIIDNPSLKSQIIEAIGKQLENFWKINMGKNEFVALETIVYEGVYYVPLSGRKEIVIFGAEDK